MIVERVNDANARCMSDFIGFDKAPYGQSWESLLQVARLYDSNGHC